MNAEEIRKQEFRPYHSGDPTELVTMTLRSAEMLRELAAQAAELNDKLKAILNPPLMYDTSKIDPVVFPELPQPITMMMNPPRATLRDQFAMAALNGVFSCNSDEFWVDVSLDVLKATSQAYKWADKMMEDRK